MKKFLPPGFFLLFICLVAVALTAAEDPPPNPPLWSHLQAGPYQPGFTTIEIVDQSRSIRPKYDYFGNLNQGDRARMLMVYVWYPAIADNTEPMYYGEYQFPAPRDDRFVATASAIQGKDVGILNALIQPTGAATIDVINIPMAAHSEAKPAEGAFPLLVYMPDGSGTACENVVLGEYLASQGFVVAALSPEGIVDFRPDLSQRDFECQIRDAELAIAHLRELPYVAADGLGVIGHGSGSIAAALLAARCYEVDALACLDPAFVYGEGASLMTDNPFYDPFRMRAPMMVVYRGDDTTASEESLQALKYTERYVQAAGGATPYDFTSRLGLITTLLDRNDSLPAQNHYTFYSGLTENINGFFTAELSSPEEPAVWPASETVQTAPAAGNWTVLEAEDAPPSPTEFRQILLSPDPGRAVELYRKFTARDSTLNLFADNLMIYVAYQALRSGNIELAVDLFEVNADAYPDRANSWDSLCEGLLALGRTEEAVDASRKVLELLPTDNTIPDSFKETLRENAVTRIAELTGQPIDSTSSGASH